MAAFDPSKTYSDNLSSLAGTDYYSKLAKKTGGNSSDVWNDQLAGLRKSYESGDMRDPAQATAWQKQVSDVFGTPMAASSGAASSGQGGITGGGSMAAADNFKAPTNLAGGSAGQGSQYEATTNTFDESKGVAGRVNSITSYGGPLMTAARTRAKQAAAKGGLLNSSLAGQAGEQAVIDSAAPIASADAQLYQSQQLANQNSLNTAAQANAQMRENARQFDKTAGINQDQFAQNLALERDNLAAQREQFAQKLGLDQASLQLNRDQLSQQDKQFLAELDAKDRQLAQQESQFARGEQNKITLAGMDAASREKLVALEASYKQEISGNENISGAWATMMESIDRIQNNPDLDASTKRTMIQNAQAGFQSFTNFWKKTSGGGVDVSDLLNFGPGQISIPSQPGRGDDWNQNPNGSPVYDNNPSSGQ